ncbi:MAG TPA: FUSC family protein [Acetobacteraceae bacterium]|nr:FUSC family protein [Acetobacteraceae bacterium]
MSALLARWRAALGGTQSRLALQCVVSLAIACAVMWLLPFPKPYWLALTALIVTANSSGETAQKSLERIVGTVLGLIAGTLFWLATSAVPVLALAGLLGCVFAIYYERTARYRTMLFWITALLSLLFHLADAPRAFYVARLADTLIGAAIAVVVTMLLLPVRTGDAVRAQIVALLEDAARQLGDTAALLEAPGPHARPFRAAAAASLAETIAGLSPAEGIEALLLRHKLAEVRRRVIAAGRIGRCLLYIDQLVPLLPGVAAGVPAALRAAGAAVAGAAEAVRSGSAPRPSASGDALARAQAAATEAYRAGHIAIDQFEAALRLDEALAVLAAAAVQVAATAPATASPRAGKPALAGRA